MHPPVTRPRCRATGRVLTKLGVAVVDVPAQRCGGA